MVVYHTQDSILLLLDVMGKSIMATYQTGPVDVVVLESINANCPDQYFDYSTGNDGIREQVWV